MKREDCEIEVGKNFELLSLKILSVMLVNKYMSLIQPLNMMNKPLNMMNKALNVMMQP